MFERVSPLDFLFSRIFLKSLLSESGLRRLLGGGQSE